MQLIIPALLCLATLLPFGTEIAGPSAAEAASPEAAAAPDVERRTSLILGYDRHSWDLFLPAGETTRIVVDGDGDSDLDAFLYDENGHLVDSDTDLTDYCILEVRPLWTGRFTLVISNVGRVANLYELRVD